MVRERSYTDEQLAAAVAVSKSWRGTLRELGLSATSAGAMRSVRARAEFVGVDFSHFLSHRITEAGVRAALASAATWADVAGELGLRGPSAIATARGHVARFGLGADHLERPTKTAIEATEPDAANLSRAGSLLAAAWFTLCGQGVSWPLEPCRYDLLVDSARGVRRVQVKTTTVRVGETWKAYLSTADRGRRTYDPSEIDDFFVIDGTLTSYLIPVSVVGGLQAIHLAAYDPYRLRPAFRGLLNDNSGLADQG